LRLRRCCSRSPSCSGRCARASAARLPSPLPRAKRPPPSATAPALAQAGAVPAQATVSPEAAATAVAPSPPVAQALPTAGPARAADAIVGAPRFASPEATRARRSPGAAEEPAAEPTPVVVAAESASSGRTAPSAPALPTPDNVYRARRFAKFSGGPAQARVYLDGRYVGIVDDWDDHGGGRTLPMPEGTHRVRLELPGYRTLDLEFIVSNGAKDETVDVDDELKRESRVDYPKLKSPYDRTIGPVQFDVDPADATVSENGKALGPASSFGLSSPLRLSGPMVHDLVLSAPGRETRTIRILVSSNADRDAARVKLSLKKQ
jgi:PEGA domain